MCTQWWCMIVERFLFLWSMAGGEGQWQPIDNWILNLADPLKSTGHTSIWEQIFFSIVHVHTVTVHDWREISVPIEYGRGRRTVPRHREFNSESTRHLEISRPYFFNRKHLMIHYLVMFDDCREIPVLVKYGRGRRTVPIDRESNSESTRPLQINRTYFDTRKNLFFHCPCAHSDGAWLKRDFCSCEVWPGEKDSDNR
jgi:hypothetical protein